ncbi:MULTISPECIES: HAMP domain-containing sensor histidine kinase [Sulfurimonas]|uniref:sensor histidine kinase n=1 Tax=Sulfurimonas TaxID=202746 RepID=UPI001264A4EF|nr:HAMP domain-containing sensor histidine kinase [Sulfurimonas indica]
MNELERRSYYSFVALYLGSSLLFILLLGYWYYSAQKNALESEIYYKLEHIADRLSTSIINAQMKGSTLELPNEKGFEYSLIPIEKAQEYKPGYYEKEGMKVLVSASPQEHLDVKYVVVKTDTYFKKLEDLQTLVLSVMVLSFGLVVIIAFVLSKLFLKPLHNRMVQIESFIQDVSHELNTPITALKMSASRAIKKEVYDKKILTNISISTKQLESIYKSLTFLNFKQKQEEAEMLNFKRVVQNVLAYYKELTDAKGIKIEAELEDIELEMIESRAELLVSNLLSNAIKYSMPETTISLKLTQEYFFIQDEGVGIEDKKLQEIFEMYKRDSQIAGGFGVGLSIVKQICNSFGMKIEVKSVLGKGSSFKVVF